MSAYYESRTLIVELWTMYLGLAVNAVLWTVIAHHPLMSFVWLAVGGACYKWLPRE